jgi:hypothetical protein
MPPVLRLMGDPAGPLGGRALGIQGGRGGLDWGRHNAATSQPSFGSKLASNHADVVQMAVSGEGQAFLWHDLEFEGMRRRFQEETPASVHHLRERSDRWPRPGICHYQRVVDD